MAHARTRLFVTGSLVAFTAALGGTAVAQPAAAGGESALEEIVVTAQKRTENLQDTPLAVSAITAETIIDRGISDVSSLTAVAPSLSITTTGAATSNIALFIRGIGESETILTVDSPVGLYVDGVVLGRSSGAVFDLVDLERIEVLRGPQGTLYGRNTIGGAVNLISRKPTETFGVDQLLSYGRFDLFQSKTTINTGELGGSGVRAQFSYLHKQRDGYVDNLAATDKYDPGAYNVDAVRASVAYDQGGPFRLNYAFDYSDKRSVANPNQLAVARPDILAYINASPALGGAAPLVARDRRNRQTLDHDGPITDKVRGHTLNLELDLGDNLTLRSLTGHRKWTNTVVNDQDGNGGLVGFVVDPILFAGGPFTPLGVQPISLFHLTFERDQRQWTQEFNLLGKIGDHTDFVLGAFYFKEKANEQNPTFLTFILPTPVPIPVAPGVSLDSFGVNIAQNIIYHYESKSQALFGQATTAVTDKLNLTGGLRYTKDDKALDQSVPSARSLSRDFDRFNWAVTADYEWSNDVMTYARVATGYKAGGFNARSANSGFEPEDLTSYEIGLKSELLDRRLRFNLALFHATHKDVQVGQFLPGTGGSVGVTVNAGKARYNGIEAEFTALVTDALTLSGNFGYTDRKYKQFEIVNPATEQLIDIASTAKFRYSPSTTANVSAEYRFPAFDFGQLVARLDYSYRSRMYWHSSTLLNPFNDVISDGGVGRLDGRLSLKEVAIGGGNAEIALWARNLTDEEYLLGGVDFGALGFGTVSYAEPRTWGVDLRVSF
ncbi:MAG: TonB-dependent receptor [Proteobacteria bacterium]|nr:TonB-dependent receptor [Pseudomonadota bacterium]